MAVPKGKTSKARKRSRAAATADTTTTRKLSAKSKRRLTNLLSAVYYHANMTVHLCARSFL